MWYLGSQPSVGSRKPVDGQGGGAGYTALSPALCGMHAETLRLVGAGVKVMSQYAES